VVDAIEAGTPFVIRFYGVSMRVLLVGVEVSTVSDVETQTRRRICTLYFRSGAPII
jgi:hypothetical protein